MKEHVKIFSGNSILSNRLGSLLEEANIPVLIKDNVESGRLAGFGVPTNSVEVFVFAEDVTKAMPILDKFEAEISK